jgi:hypothetical protein
MGTKLVKLQVPDTLHRRIKTVAASKDKKLTVYMLEVLEQHVPKQITFSDTEGKKKPQGDKSIAPKI